MIPAPGQPLPPAPGQPPVVVVHRRGGMNCFAVGCIVVLVLILLGVALAVGLGYFTYNQVRNVTSSEPTAIPSFDGGDAMYQDVTKKIDAFQQAAQANQPARLELSGDEINTLITHSPNYGGNFKAFVSLHGDSAKLQVSMPTSALPINVLPGRYLNAEAEFTPDFDSSSRHLNVTLHSLKIGGNPTSQENLATVQMEFNPMLNTQLQRSPDVMNVLNHATSVTVQDSKLVIQTQ